MSKKTIHFVYAFGPKKSSPNAIGNELTLRLLEDYQVIQYQWDSKEPIVPQPGDILLGHPHPDPNTCFRKSVRNRDFSRKIMMCPYCHGNPSYSAFQDSVIRDCDLYLAITGTYWFHSMGRSLYRDWIPKTRQLELAVNRKYFPKVKLRFNPSGERRFVYIGSKGFHKNTDYLAEIAGANPGLLFSWIGGDRSNEISGFNGFGYVDFQTNDGQELIAKHDFLITVGNSDPNPTTILEAMSWGLIPICTPQSGYYNVPGIINVPLDNVGEASRILWRVNLLQESRLLEMQAFNSQALDDLYNYDKFASQVVEAIESTESPRISSNPLRRALLLYYANTAYYPGSPLMELAARPGTSLRRIPSLYIAIRFLHRKIRALVDARIREK
jgi:hypothetical protein